ncbi:MAG: SLC13 family permease [Actinomycetota bacterium]|nr:SLC13 family permease [Actinomycetota bacterium]
MTGGWAEALALLALAAVLVFAMVQPRGLPEAMLAVPAAGLLIGLGVVTPAAAWEQMRLLGPTVGFLAAILLLAHLADAEGVFAWLGVRLARASRGRPTRLLGLVFLAAAVTTAVLSLDATVVLLTPVVFATAARVRARARPHVYACTHLANSASTLLPVSNLTNLLAFTASGLSFAGFAALMGLPWLVAVGVEYLVFRRFFRTDLTDPATTGADAAGRGVAQDSSGPPTPTFAFVVLALTLVGFGVSGLVGIEPVWVAVAGAAVLAVRALARRSVGVRAMIGAASPLFCLFVFALGVVVAGVSTHGLGAAIAAILPTTPTLLGLLAVAGLAAVLANVVNNLPATLVMLTALGSGAHPGLVLAMLIGVNIGPNLTYVGSLATLLWRRVLAGADAAPTLSEFLRLGALTVPACLIAAVATLWLGLTLGQGWLT